MQYSELIAYLKNTITTGGTVLGAFSNEMLKGFVSVESTLFGTNKEYLHLSNIGVSKDMHGKELFQLVKIWTKN